MVEEDDGTTLEARPAGLDDLVTLCRKLNREGARVRHALMELPDQAVRDMTDDDLDHYVVVRVADEFVVDLMKAAGGVE